jgi:nucleoside-diphosphate-sugar epimerase
VYGPRDHGIAEIARPIYRFRTHVLAGFRTPPLSLIYVQDLVHLILASASVGEVLAADAVEEHSPHGVYFACDDSEHPNYRELGIRLAEVMNRRVFVLPVVRFASYGIAGTAQLANRLRGRSSYLNVDKVREGAAPSWTCSAAKSRQHLGFAPEKNLDQRLAETAQWLIQHGWV